MAKKVRRVRRRSVRKSFPEPSGPVPEEEGVLQKKQGVSVEIGDDLELQEEYAYVMQDLRRVFILAAALFVLLIALNLLLG